MLINEIFYSIQGEGRLAGLPSVFIRFAGCNLRCGWCDTPSAAWQAQGAELPLDEIIARVRAYPSRYCVFTGGEPMLARERRDLTEQLHNAGKHITIETNGTIPPGKIACDLASLSPKLANSTPRQGELRQWRERHDQMRIQIDALRRWIDNYDYQLKFVMVSRQDVDEINALLSDLQRDIPPEKVLLMPEGIDLKTLHKHAELAVEICREYGYRYSPRLHIELFGNKRGT